MTQKKNNDMTAPFIEIDFSTPFLVWKTLEFDYESCTRDAVEQTLAKASIPSQIADKELEVSIVLTNDEMIADLNRTYKDKRGPTNVLSFASIDSSGNDAPVIDGIPFVLGDIVLSFETLEREHKEQNKTFRDHYTHMVTHGMLHLLGYDHEEDDEAEIMESLETDILKSMGIENPYKDS